MEPIITENTKVEKVDMAREVNVRFSAKNSFLNGIFFTFGVIFVVVVFSAITYLIMGNILGGFFRELFGPR